MAFQSVTDEAVQQIQSTGSEGADTQTPSESSSAPDVQAEPSQGAKQLEAVADLSKFKKILLDGQELSLDELKKERLRESDYRRKTMELAEERKQHQESAKFDVAYRSDLKVIKSQPWRAAEFYKMYPSEYHDEVKWIEKLYKDNPSLWADGEPQGQKQATRPDQGPDLEKLVEEQISRRLKPLEEKEARERERTYLAEMDSRETKLMQKYKRANKFEVYAAAEYLSKEGDNGEPRALTDTDWEKLFKESHERTVDMIKQAQAEEFNNQKQANAKLKDVQSGGGIPGEAPVVPRSLKEAKEHFLRLNEG